MKNKYLLGFLCFGFIFLLGSCESVPKSNNEEYKNYMIGNESSINKNNQQLQERQTSAEKKFDLSNYEQNRPKSK